ncbi:thioredoxin family protein [Clostridiaceae bacterium]|nr:thioredoxin family protein [Clostridiaceae bacterium]
MEIVEENAEQGCDCGGGCCGTDAQEETGLEAATILVLGTGCKNCQALEANVKEALKKMGKTISVGHVTELDKIASYGVMSTPGLVVNGKVVSTGKVLKADAIVELLEKNL